jgi:3-oxoacyl-[acyl-carrier protein] reductase
MAEKIDLKGRVALITGASRGIGKAIALRLAGEGARILASASSRERLDSTIIEIQNNGGEAQALPCDLSQPQQVQQLAQHAMQAYRQLDILVNNAGTSVKKPYYESTDEEWTELFAVNAMAPFILCRECLPALKQSDAAAIIQIGSVVAIKGYEGQALYSASKHALLGFTKVLAQEVQPFGVRVHTINPGGVYTDMVKTMRPDLDPNGLIQPEEIADVVHFLLTNRGNAFLDDIHIRRANGAPWY